jgi:hypothetical protein
MNSLLRGTMAFLAVLLGFPSAATLRAADDVPELLAAIKAVGKEGAGNVAAAKAWQALARRGPDVLPDILAGFDDDNPVAANWLRAATDDIGERSLREKMPLPVAALERFLLEAHNSAAGRQAAYKWLVRADPGAPARLLAGFLHDRSPELRREAVDNRIQAANLALGKADKTAAVALLREALSGACDKDQVADIAKKLKEQGIEVDLAAHFGFICSWYVIGPFDNAKGTKHAVVYPPEKAIDLNAVYKGQGDVDCRWTPFTTADAYGKVDFNRPIGKKKEAIAYALGVVDSPVERRAEIRVGCATAVKVFHNGKEALRCDEYYHGIPDMDQFVIPVVLKAGRNDILVKICQNEETGSWAEQWWFQARLSDATGAAIPFTVALKPAASQSSGSR